MKLKKLLPAVVISLLVTSCKVPQNVTYFPDLKDGQIDQIIHNDGIKLKSDDKISIVVKSKSAEITNMLNLPVANQIVGYAESRTESSSRGISAYTIDSKGEIDFPVLGHIKVADLTREQVAEKVKNEIEKRALAKDVVVTVEFLNLHFSVLGEVSKPGQYSFGRDRVSILEALSMAGDLNLYGRRDSIFVQRDVDGQRFSYYVNLLDGKGLVNSPVYYLQQNDIVYVQPNDMQKRRTKVNGNNFQSSSFWMSLTSVLVSVITLINRL